MTLDRIEQQICDALQDLCGRSVIDGSPTRQWTNELMLGIGRIGKRIGCDVYSGSHPDKGEWLCYMTWIRSAGGCTEEIVLVLESEWAG